MNKSTLFISLSGMSGISTGLVALAGAFAAYKYVYQYPEFRSLIPVHDTTEQQGVLLIIACGTLFLSALSAILFTKAKTLKSGQSPWNFQSRRLLFHLLIPLVAGGVLCLMMLLKGITGILPSMTLIFYGLALVNGSKFTILEIRNLGFLQIILGWLAFIYMDYGLIFWALGFGVIQMIYGFIVQKKY